MDIEAPVEEQRPAGRAFDIVPADRGISEDGLREAFLLGAVDAVRVVEQSPGWFRVCVSVRFKHAGGALTERWVIAYRRHVREWRSLNRLVAQLQEMAGASLPSIQLVLINPYRLQQQRQS